MLIDKFIMYVLKKVICQNHASTTEERQVISWFWSQESQLTSLLLSVTINNKLLTDYWKYAQKIS